MKPVDVTEALESYMEGLLPVRDPVLARMEDEAHREGIPIVDAHEGALLSLLVKLAGAKRLLAGEAGRPGLPVPENLNVPMT